jgi:hypothetical protein
VNEGQPTRPLPNLVTHKTKTGQYTRHFCIFQYEKFGWLPGCATKNKFIIGPFYFPNKHEECNKQGFSDLNPLSSAQKKTRIITNSCALLFTVTLIWKTIKG